LTIFHLCNEISRVSIEISKAQKSAAWETLQRLEKQQRNLLKQLPDSRYQFSEHENTVLTTTLENALLVTQAASSRTSEWQKDVAVLLQAFSPTHRS
jgi:SAM-dependent MidA family methyltransferase